MIPKNVYAIVYYLTLFRKTLIPDIYDETRPGQHVLRTINEPVANIIPTVKKHDLSTFLNMSHSLGDGVDTTTVGSRTL